VDKLQQLTTQLASAKLKIVAPADREAARVASRNATLKLRQDAVGDLASTYQTGFTTSYETLKHKFPMINPHMIEEQLAYDSSKGILHLEHDDRLFEFTRGQLDPYESGKTTHTLVDNRPFDVRRIRKSGDGRRAKANGLLQASSLPYATTGATTPSLPTATASLYPHGPSRKQKKQRRHNVPKNLKQPPGMVQQPAAPPRPSTISPPLRATTATISPPLRAITATNESNPSAAAPPRPNESSRFAMPAPHPYAYESNPFAYSSPVVQAQQSERRRRPTPDLYGAIQSRTLLLSAIPPAVDVVINIDDDITEIVPRSDVEKRQSLSAFQFLSNQPALSMDVLRGVNRHLRQAGRDSLDTDAGYDTIRRYSDEAAKLT
jgi:hypothetical protein